MNELKRCLKRGRLVEIDIDEDWIDRELKEANNDLESAKESLEDEDYKWAIIQAYYSMFHAAKGLVLKKGYREKGHACLLIALEWLYVKENILDRCHLEWYEDAMDLRHDADYGMTYSNASAKILIENAQKFLNEAETILRKA